MAGRPKKEITDTIEVKESNIDVEKILKEKEDSDNKLKELQIQMELLMKQMSMMNQSQPHISNQDDIDIIVGCRALNGATLISKNGEIEYDLKYKEEREIPFRELKECFKNNVNNYRDLFKKGVFYFVDKNMYDEFSIKDILDLSEENLIEILLRNEIPFEDKLYVRGQKDMALYMTVLYIVADLYCQGKLTQWNYGGRIAFENHYKTKLDDMIRQIQSLR